MGFLWWTSKKEKNIALIRAAAGGHIETVKAMLDNGADVNAKDRFGRPALMIADFFDHKQIVNLLKRYGVTE